MRDARSFYALIYIYIYICVCVRATGNRSVKMPTNLILCIFQLGKLYHFKGKILQLLSTAMSHLSLDDFPLRLKSIKGDCETEFIFFSKGHALQECVASFTKAYEFFRAVGNDLRIGKAVTRIGEVYALGSISYIYIYVCVGVCVFNLCV